MTDTNLSTNNHKAGRYPCANCGKRFLKPCLLQRHAAVHTTTKDFKCTECDKYFSQKSSLQRHNAQQHNGTKQHQCPKCPRSFTQRGNMLKHLQQVHPAKSLEDHLHKFACDQCTCVFTKQNLLSRHKRAMHQNQTTNTDSFPEDVNALAQQVLQQLKSLQSGMQILERDKHDSEFELPTNIVTKDQQVANATVEEHFVSNSIVQLKDRLRTEHTQCVINVQRIQRADGHNFYVCEYCAKEFRKSYDFIRHRRTHTNERPYQCCYCQRACKTRTQLHAHARIHRLDERLGVLARQHNCAVCQHTCSSMRQLDAHMCIHQQTHTWRYLCNQCPGNFATKTAFSTHKHIQPDESYTALQNLLPAPIVLNKNKEFEATLAAERIAFEQRPFTCNICAWKLKTQKQLNQHLKRHELRCAKCNRCFTSTATLRLHRRWHHRYNHRSTAFSCTHCSKNKIFASLPQFKRHLEHCKAIKNYKCAYCIHSFKNSSHCRSHMRIHLRNLLNTGGSKERSKAARSTTANSGFIVVSMNADADSTASKQQEKWLPIDKLSMSVTRHTSNDTSRNAALDGTSLPTQTLYPNDSLAKHKCPNCQKCFQKPSDLQRHARTHNDEKLHECPVCHKRFRLPYTLQQHQLTHQSERRRYGCQVCGKTYATPSVLKIHLRLHTGVLPFQCTICMRCFRTSGHRIAHMRATHQCQSSVRQSKLSVV